MVFMSFFFSYGVLSIGIGHDEIGLKVVVIAQADKQADTHSVFVVLGLTMITRCAIAIT